MKKGFEAEILKDVSGYIRGKLNGEWSGRHYELAEITGAHQTSISRVARGANSPRLDFAQKMLDVFLAEDRQPKRRVHKIK